ncbi:MAG: ribosome small subunit-dependent GTPase A [Chlamydiae bacterium CG10_big_fil_rev_8_21_14_0_10_42_34]|nr:MAG: ribosome small subunit-dependent GTPase A [Chlamydiae bacterium CG10_big_fil_rev_8_21_14_0_10_42_34]
MTREYDFEEDFHGKDRKQWRKERKQAQATDRSKFKKTDVEKKTRIEIDPSWGRGRVVAISGEGFWVDSNGTRILCSLKGFFKKEKVETKNILAVGDLVRFTSEYAIAYIEDRYSFLARTDISGRKEQLIAVNIDQAIIAISVVNPALKPALVDRYLIAAAKGNIQPIIVINKTDLLEEASVEEQDRYREFLTEYEKLGIPILSLSAEKLTGIDALRSLLKDKASVFSGQSGVGKSSLLNVAYGLKLKTGGLAHKTFKGTHTTTTAELLSLPGGGYCVDTPGVRSFGVWKLKKEEVTGHFHDLAEQKCKFQDCQHINEPDCGVLKAIEEGHISKIRYESYRTLLDEAIGRTDNRTKRKEKHESD